MVRGARPLVSCGDGGWMAEPAPTPASQEHPRRSSEVFCRDGKVLREGDHVTMPRLADTLETLASEGAQAFYNGSLTAQIVKDIQEAGEWVTPEACGRKLRSWNLEPGVLGSCLDAGPVGSAWRSGGGWWVTSVSAAWIHNSWLSQR